MRPRRARLTLPGGAQRSGCRVGPGPSRRWRGPALVTAIALLFSITLLSGGADRAHASPATAGVLSHSSGSNLYGLLGITSTSQSDVPVAAVLPARATAFTAHAAGQNLSVVLDASSAQLSSPLQGATLSGTSQAFSWNAVPGASQYALWVGGSAGTYNYYYCYTGSTCTGTTSATATGLPANASTVYVRLWTLLSPTWSYNDYTFTAATLVAQLSSPVQGTTLTGASQTFTWNAVPGATAYALWAGSSAGAYNYYYCYTASSSFCTSATSTTATGLPVNGSTVYVRLWSQLSDGWSSADYTFTAVTLAAQLTSPAQGATLAGASQAFSWNAPAGATQYALWAGSSAGADDYYYCYTGSSCASTTSTVATGLPVNGSTVYVRLWTLVGGSWGYFDYTFAAASPTVAQLSSPLSGATLSGASQQFTWTAVAGATQYKLLVGSSLGAYDYYYCSTLAACTGTTSTTATGLPMNGSTVYVELWTIVGSKTAFVDYTFKAASPTVAQLSSPLQGATLTGSSQAFSWNAASGATQYAVWAGSSAGAYDYYNCYTGSSCTSATSTTATGLPVNGTTVYVRLWTLVGGSWSSIDYTFTAAMLVAQLCCPTQGFTLYTSSQFFRWTTPASATQYSLWVGSSVGAYDYYYCYTGSTCGSTATTTATGLPVNGSTIYARLWTLLGGAWLSKDYTFTAATAAQLSSPVQGAKLAGLSQQFTWNAVPGATGYYLTAGRSPGDNRYYDCNPSSCTSTTSITATGLPALAGVTVYVRLTTVRPLSQEGYMDYTFTSVAAALAQISSPAQGATLTGASQQFTWNAVPGATAYLLLVGSFPGGENYYGCNTGNTGTICTGATSATVTGLPVNGSTVYARLYTIFSTNEQSYTDFTFTAA